MSSFNLIIIDVGGYSVSCDFQQYSKYGYITNHVLMCLRAKWHYTKLGYAVVMNTWNVDAQQRRRLLTWAESCYILSVSNNSSYLLVSIMLLSQNRVAMIFNVKSKINSIAFTIKTVLNANLTEKWAELHGGVMQWIYVYFIVCV